MCSTDGRRYKRWLGLGLGVQDSGFGLLVLRGLGFGVLGLSGSGFRV